MSNTFGMLFAQKIRHQYCGMLHGYSQKFGFTRGQNIDGNPQLSHSTRLDIEVG